MYPRLVRTRSWVSLALAMCPGKRGFLLSELQKQVRSRLEETPVTAGSLVPSPVSNRNPQTLVAGPHHTALHEAFQHGQYSCFGKLIIFLVIYEIFLSLKHRQGFHTSDLERRSTGKSLNILFVIFGFCYLCYFVCLFCFYLQLYEIKERSVWGHLLILIFVTSFSRGVN